MLTRTDDPPNDATRPAVLLHLARVLAGAAAPDRSGDGRPAATAGGAAATRPDDPTHTALVAVVGPLPRVGADPVDLAVRPLDGHPVDVLLGFVAPSDWSAIGVVAPATARHMGADAGVSPPFGDGERIVMVHLLGRDGVGVSVGRRADGSFWESSADPPEPGAEPEPGATGRLDDVLRRVLGLPTRPPTVGPAELWARLWLDRVLSDVGSRPDREWSWRSIAVLHPAAQLVVDDLRGRLAEVVQAMPRLAEILARGRSWDDLRLGYESGQWATPSIPPDLARWMDDGIFSRWLLAELPPCGEALVALRDLLPRRLIRRIDSTLAGWNVSTALGAEGGWTAGSAPEGAP